VNNRTTTRKNFQAGDPDEGFFPMRAVYSPSYSSRGTPIRSAGNIDFRELFTRLRRRSYEVKNEEFIREWVKWPIHGR
jgi:hypothetical protein